MRSLSKAPGFLALLLPALFLTGCGLTVQQRAAVLKFSDATKTFAGAAANEFSQSRVDVIQMNTFRAKLGETNIAENLDAPLTADRVKVRVEAVNALGAYAELLQLLTTSSKTEELKVASDKLVANLRKVKGVNLTDDKAGAVGSAVQLLGGLLVEHLRAKAVERVTANTDESIRKLLDLIERDFSPDDDFWSLGYDLTVSTLKRSAALAEKNVNQNDLGSAAICSEARALAEKNKSRSAMVSAQILEMIKNLRLAQTELLYTTKAKGLTLERMNDLAAKAEEFRTLYEILRKGEH